MTGYDAQVRQQLAQARIELATAQAELAQLHAGEEPYDDDCLIPSPAQWIWAWNRSTPEKRLEWADHAIELAEHVSQARSTLVLHGDRPGLEQAMHAALNGPTEQPTCCVCGTTEHGGRAFYENYTGLLFCWPCADCDCGQPVCVRTGIADPAVSSTTAPAPVPTLANLGRDALAALIRAAQHQLAIVDPERCPADCAEGHTYQPPCSGAPNPVNGPS